ncbi:MAG: PEGA domain-containing protein [Patescibacteria group bacterium]
MNLKYRRILYSSFIALFLIITPIVTFYAAGYRYNLKKHRIEKTGILYLDSKPRGAQIFINGKYQNKTPARFPYLLPDIYQVEVKKEGYHSWQKNLEIKSNLTTFGKDIVLFKNNLPINIIQGDINIFVISPSQDKIIYSIIKDNLEELRLFNLNNKTDFLIKDFNKQKNDELEFISWSLNPNKILVKNQTAQFNKYLVVDIDTLKIKELFDITRLNFDKVAWDSVNENYLYGLSKKILYQIDLANNSAKQILPNEIQDFETRGNDIYYINTIKNESYLNKFYLTPPAQIVDQVEKIKLIAGAKFSLQNSPANYVILLDKNSNDLFIINTKVFIDGDINKNIVLQDKAQKIIWSLDNKNLLYYTDLEIRIFNLDTQQKSLVTRYGSVINQAAWYPTNKYLVYQVENAIRIIETSSQEPRNDLKIAELQKITSFIIDNAGKNIYFVGQAGALQGIYQLEIQ